MNAAQASGAVGGGHVSSQSFTVGVDVGGTKVLGGVVGADGCVVARTRRESLAEDPARLLESIVDVIGELSSHYEIETVGVGAAGWIDETLSTVLFSPNLAWRYEPLRDEISRQVGLPVVVENDANVATWAEFRFGAARSALDSTVLFTVGTGIGGGIVLGGELVRGAHGIAAEMGHTRVVPDGHPCGCGRQGCLEQYASGNALVRFAQSAAKDQPDAAKRLLDLAGGAAEAIDGPTVTRAARAGDKVALSVFDQVGYWLGNSMADVVQLLDPEMIVIGGGVVEAGELLLRPTRTAYRRALYQRGRIPVADVAGASMANLAGMVGAADLARRSWESSRR